MDLTMRREFLKLAAAGVAGGAVLPSEPAGHPAEDRAAMLNVRTFGAKGDDKAIDSRAINQAIDAVAAAGGGTIYFPAGKYLSHSIRLKSKVALFLDLGAEIVAAEPLPAGQKGGYDLAEPKLAWDAYQDYGHNHWHNSLIWGEDISNVAIYGPGLIWGRGLSRGWDTETPRAETAGVANKAIALKNCFNVTLKDFSILHGGHFGILATGVDNLTIDNLKIDTNRDGMDIDCCRNVRVSNCSINSPYDDGICLKSSFALGYARATEFVTITNCFVSGMVEGTLLDGTYKKKGGTGRIKFGTESNGGFRNITVSNCVLYDCGGLVLESEDGALLEDIAISNISMREMVNAPIFLRLGSRMRGPQGVPVGTVKRVKITNVVVSQAKSAAACTLSGVPGHAIQDVTISGVHIEHLGGGTAEDAARAIPELETHYPEPDMFGRTPAQGFYLRHVHGIEMSDIRVQALSEDARPVFVLDEVEGGEFYRVRGSSGAKMFRLSGVKGFTVEQSRPVPDMSLESVERGDW